MHYYRFIVFTFVLITHGKILGQALDILFPVPLDETETEDLFDTPDQDIFESLDNDGLTLPAETPLDFLSSKSDSCTKFQSFRRIRVRSDDLCNDDQSIPGSSDNPLLDFNQILGPAREGFKTQEQIVNFICPAATFQGILDIPVCGHAGDFGVTQITPPAQFFASILSNFRLYHVTYATLCKLIFVCCSMCCVTIQNRLRGKAKRIL